MNPVYRRSTKFYLWSALTYLAVMGRYMITRDWPVFEIIPFFMPIWLVSALFASEDDERYAFLRMLPVPDGDVARAKFVLILGSSAFQWTLMTGAALARMDEGIADLSTLVYLTLVCVFGLLAAAGYQIAIWRYGISTMKPILIASIIAGIAFAIIHLASLKNVDNWPALSRSAVVEWLGGAPWISNVVLAALALLGFRALLRAGIRVKAASEAHL
jgi:ABC-2 family transporter protein